MFFNIVVLLNDVKSGWKNFYLLWLKYFVNFLFFWKRQTCNVTDGTLIGRRRSASVNTTSYCKKEVCNKGNDKNHITGNRLHTIQENVVLDTSLRIIHQNTLHHPPKMTFSFHEILSHDRIRIQTSGSFETAAP